jgi:prepilin-type processing-associated H-X9-DG protein
VLGTAGGDNEPWNNSGWDQDHVRFGESVPQPDSMHPTSASPTYWSVRFGGPHPGGFNAVMGDGSVRFISYNVDADNWRRLALIADGEVITFNP